jgi:ribose transport system permease protein
MGSVSMIFDAMMGIFIAFFLQKYCNLAIGVVVGTFTMKMLNSGLVSMGLSTTVRDITTGLFLLILLCISANQGKFTEWRNNREKARLANEKYRQARA